MLAFWAEKISWVFPYQQAKDGSPAPSHEEGQVCSALSVYSPPGPRCPLELELFNLCLLIL